jgi:hypothetical protein
MHTLLTAAALAASCYLYVELPTCWSRWANERAIGARLTRAVSKACQVAAGAAIAMCVVSLSC